MSWRNNLLWIDATAGLTVGTGTLTLFPFLQALYGLPTWVLLTMGIANLAYCSYSFSLARSATRTRGRLMTLVIANAMWSVLCVVAAVLLASDITTLGIGQFLFEGAFVGSLAMLEWRMRHLLIR